MTSFFVLRFLRNVDLERWEMLGIQKCAIRRPTRVGFPSNILWLLRVDRDEIGESDS